MKKYRILSIDAWADGADGWEWNDWFKVGEITEIPTKNEDIIQLFINEGYINETAKKLVYVSDDQYNLTITEIENHKPLYAIEYGNVEEENE